MKGAKIGIRQHQMRTFSLLLSLFIALSTASNAASAGPFVYAPNSQDVTVSVIDSSSNTVPATIPIGGNLTALTGVAISPDSTVGYVGGYQNTASGTQKGTVSVINTGANAVTANIPLGSAPFGIAFTPSGAFAYVTDFDLDVVWIIDTAGRVVAGPPIPVGSGPAAIAITPDGAFVYVVNNLGDSVSIIDTSSNAVVNTVQVGHFPGGIATTPDGASAYIANPCGEDTSCESGGTVSVLSTASRSITQTIPIGQFGSQFVTFTPDGNFAYVANTCGNDSLCLSLGTVSIIDTRTSSVVGSPISVGGAPAGLKVTPDGSLLYVANQCGNGPGGTDGFCSPHGTVSVIAITTNAVIATVPVGWHPGFLAIASVTKVAFASFTVRLQLALSTGSFDLISTFTLGVASNGINPLIENLILQIGPYAVTIPRGSFTQNKKGAYVFQGTLNSIALQVQISPTGSKSDTFKAQGSGANLNGTANPVTVTLTIGDDAGSTQVNAQIS